MNKCVVTECLNPVKFRSTQQWGEHLQIFTCAEHKPGKLREQLSPDHPVHKIPLAYKVESVEE